MEPESPDSQHTQKKVHRLAQGDIPAEYLFFFLYHERDFKVPHDIIPAPG
jgi:hypothetical protein